MLSLRLRMLGTGSAFSKSYWNTSALVEYDHGYNLLIDCGFTVPNALHLRGISLDHIDGVLITHIHADHVGGLEELAFSYRYLYGGKKIDLWLPRMIGDDLWEKSLRGGLEHTEEGICTLEDYFNVHLLDYSVPRKDLGICIYPTTHVKLKESYAVGIGEEVFFSGDTKFDRKLIEDAAEQYKYIFHDCQLWTGGIHASLEELLTLPNEIQERIFLMHYGDNVEDFVGKTGKMRFADLSEDYFF